MIIRASFFRHEFGFWATIIASLGIILVIEFSSAKTNYSIDLTKYKRYSLTQPTKKLLDSLDRDIRLTVLMGIDAPEYKQVKNLCQRYAEYNSRISYQFVDPNRNPGLLKHYEVVKYGPEKRGNVIVTAGNRKELVTIVNEEGLTNAILRLTNPTRKVIYFLQGHGENDPFMPTNLESFKSNPKSYRLAKEALEERIWNVKALYLVTGNGVPEDASLLLVCGPEVEIPAEEVKAIEEYLTRGGHVFFLLDPFTGQELKALFRKYNIILGDDIIIDKVNRIQGSDFFTPVVSTYVEHIITKDLRPLSTVFSWARSVDFEPSFVPGLDVQALLKTGQESWSTEDLEGINRGEVTFSPQKSKKGPLPLGVIASFLHDKMSTRLAVIGDSDFASDIYLNLYANRDLFLNTVSWLGEEEKLMSLTVNSPQYQYNPLSKHQAHTLFWFPVIIQPGVVILAGVLVSVWRRMRS